MQNLAKLMLLALWFACCQATAATPADLYDAEAVVADEGVETRNATLSRLLGDVLVRVSGNARIGAQPAAREVLDRAPSLVEQYRYRTADQDGEVQRILWARFDRGAVERMLRERNLPVWVQRPRVLLWVATERGGRRALLNLDNLPEGRAAVLARAQQRGMPLQLPLMDLEDQGALTPADLWSDYADGIQRASARYPHEVVVTGRLRAASSGKWSGSWSLIDGDAVQVFETPPQPLTEALAAAVDQTQDLLAARLAPLASSGTDAGTLVSFSGVRDLAAYGRLAALVKDVETLGQAALRHVEGDRFVFEFRVRGDQRDLARALEASGQIATEPAPPVPLRPWPADTLSSGGPAPLGAPVDDLSGTGVPPGEPPQLADLYYRLLY
ncbi:MAG: DUF2066 domain-containing protein [Chromatiaceae bacterium]|nr:DUF2066 domain-containing protein [Gammaproteobacteria bacterium]MCP5303963.1 DUF2066 domain-containing protein [Chromatiaceae bacterium]MCP5313690.1 DUF2066 domain-containing protein [Chromatiaceae bacterium]